LLGDNSLSLEFIGDVLDAHNRVPALVGLKEVGSQGIATSMPDAAIGVDDDSGHVAGTGKISGSDSTDRSAAV
jgi:hypothetical protein